LTEIRDRVRRRKGRKKAREGEKVAERKMTKYAPIRAGKLRFKCGVKLTEKSARRALKVTERKLDNTHLLEVCETIFKED
jgi:hypothetical protein